MACATPTCVTYARSGPALLSLNNLVRSYTSVAADFAGPTCVPRRTLSTEPGHMRDLMHEHSMGMLWVDALLENHPQMADFYCPL